LLATVEYDSIVVPLGLLFATGEEVLLLVCLFVELILSEKREREDDCDVLLGNSTNRKVQRNLEGVIKRETYSI